MTPDPGADSLVQRFQWLGRDAMYLDTPSVVSCGNVVIGRYGGNRDAGAGKNEDGALVWCEAGGAWEFAVVLDAHASADSAALVLATIAAGEQVIQRLLSEPVATAFTALEQHLIALFSSAQFRAACRTVRGETACLITARKAQFVWWFSVGDCALYLLHPELASHGQFALNQRSFYEWIGQVNTFELPVACYSSGVQELRSGVSVLLLTTDGLLQDNALPFATPEGLYQWFSPDLVRNLDGMTARVRAALSRVHDARGRDSATVIARRYDNGETAAQPTG